MLITDWNMPVMDGVELARRLRALSATSQYIYIILLTGRGELNDMVQGFTQGMLDSIYEIQQCCIIPDRLKMVKSDCFY